MHYHRDSRRFEDLWRATSRPGLDSRPLSQTRKVLGDELFTESLIQRNGCQCVKAIARADKSPNLGASQRIDDLDASERFSDVMRITEAGQVRLCAANRGACLKEATVALILLERVRVVKATDEAVQWVEHGNSVTRELPVASAQLHADCSFANLVRSNWPVYTSKHIYLAFHARPVREMNDRVHEGASLEHPQFERAALHGVDEMARLLMGALKVHVIAGHSRDADQTRFCRSIEHEPEVERLPSHEHKLSSWQRWPENFKRVLES